MASLLSIRKSGFEINREKEIINSVKLHAPLYSLSCNFLEPFFLHFAEYYLCNLFLFNGQTFYNAFIFSHKLARKLNFQSNNNLQKK